METFKEFGVDLSGLTEPEREMVEKLTDAGRIIAELYEEQKNIEYPGANLYPPGLVRADLEEEAEKNEDLLHPYTFVEEAKIGKFKSVPFTSRFKTRLKEASKLIKEAAGLAPEPEFKKYLKEMAESLLDKEYGRNEILWVTQEPAKFNFIIGPVDMYLDKLFFKKCSYQAWLGITDERATEEANRFRDIILASRRKILPGTAKVKLPELRIDINRTIYFAGEMADYMATGTNLPNKISFMEEYGSRMTIFESSLNHVFEERNHPIFQKLFDERAREYFSQEELKTGLLRLVLLHEISHSLVRYEDADERLKNLFPVFDELLAYILGIRSCDSLLLKDVLTEKDVEAIITVFINRCFRYWKDARDEGTREHYAQGCAIAVNFLLEEGGLEDDGCSYQTDFSKLFISIDHLSRMLEYHLASGSYEEARKFVERYSSGEAFEKCWTRWSEEEKDEV